MKAIVQLILFLSVLASGLAYLSSALSYIKYKLNIENCDENFIGLNLEQLQKDFKKLLFGQDIAVNRLLLMLKSHFENEPSKALVICMHGWTGSGKNYATKIMIDNIYRKKTESQFVHFYNGRLNFPVDLDEYVVQYKHNVQRWIRGNVSQCERSLFVFDEIDKMPRGIIDAIKPYFDYHEKIDSVNFRKSIFVFISNIGSEVINSHYNMLWRGGKLRSDMQYKDFEPYLINALYSAEGGFKESSVIDSHLVSLYLPFLPMEETQVRQCIITEAKKFNLEELDEVDISFVLDELEFKDRLSTSGCKRVPDLVPLLKYRRALNDEL